MAEERVSPPLLKVVAGLFILSGLMAFGEVAFRLTQQQIYLNYVVVDLFIGYGLLYHRSLWRTLAFFDCALSVLLLAWSAWLVFGARAPLTLMLFGSPIESPPGRLFVAALVVASAVSVFKFWVLTLPEVRRVFAHTPNKRMQLTE